MKYKKPVIPDFSTMTSTLSDKAVEEVEKEVEAWADKEAKGFRNRIEKQDFPSFKAIPLSSWTLKRKKAFGFGTKTMISTRHYIDGIRAFSYHKQGRLQRIRIGFHPLSRARGYDGKIKDILLSEVAYIQENGSAAANIPARPHWGPHRAAMMIRAVALRKSIQAKIAAKLKKSIKRGGK